MNRLTHVTGSGEATMVDVSGKRPQRRRAKAQGRIELADQTVRLIRENDMKKGDVLAVARLAGIQAAKQAAIQLGVKDLTQGKVMVIGATGSIGSVCSRLLAQAIGEEQATTEEG